MRRLSVVVAGLAMSLVLSAPAYAAVELGDSTSTPSGPGMGPKTYVQTASGSGASYTVPAGGGVITGWAGQVAAAAGEHATFKLKILRPGLGGAYFVVGSAPGPVVGIGALTRSVFPARIPVQANDVLGIYVPTATAAVGGASMSGATVTAGPGEAADNSTFTPTSPSSNIGLLISATLEPDADSDQFGDESQDACPLDSLRHEAPCATDLAASLKLKPRSLRRGGLSFLTATVRAAALQAPGASVKLTLPRGVKLVASGSAAGDCARNRRILTCPLGDIPAGGLRRAFLLVKATKKRGSLKFTAKAQSAGADTNPANDLATGRLKVRAPRR